MSYISSQIIPSLRTISILADFNAFETWFLKRYPQINIDELFKGYKFSIECCLNTFIDGIAHDKELGIENDFLLERALAESIPLHKIDNTCEKTIFLKNLKPFIKSINCSTNFQELENAVHKFKNEVSCKLDTIMEGDYSAMNKLGVSKSEAIRLILIDFAYTYLVQIKGNGPYGNMKNPISNTWLSKRCKEDYLEGYKYAIQFLWFNILGENEFNNTALHKMNTVNSWCDYIYIDEASENDLFMLMNNRFELEKQTCLDSYFYWIKEQVVEPIEKKYNFQLYSFDNEIKYSLEKYSKDNFVSLLDSSIVPKLQLSYNDKIENLLLWYPVEIIPADKKSLHLGIPSFNTMVAGTVALHGKGSEFSKIRIARFIHPDTKNITQKNYSYGILIDTQSAAGYYSSGWVIYQNACIDNSGFSSDEHQSVEKLLTKYEEQKLIDISSLTISLDEFIKFTNQHLLDNKEISILEQNKLIPDIIQKARAYLFELFTYYLNANYYSSRKYEILLNTDSEEGERDVIIKSDTELILIECKLNAQNYDIDEVIGKLNKKQKPYSNKIVSCQLWTWFPLSTNTKSIIESKSLKANINLKIVEVSQPKGEPFLKGVDLKKMKFIMQDYKEAKVPF